MLAPYDRTRRFRPQLLQLEDRAQPSASPSVLLDTGAGDLTSVNGEIFFVASDGSAGAGLWKTDGTAAGTSLIKGGFTGLTPISDLTNVNGALFFVANDGVHGRQLWESDGTTAGTAMLTDLTSPPYQLPPFTAESLILPKFYDDSGPRDLLNVNGVLYFAGDEPDHGYELWRSDGTVAGTRMIADINPGPNGSFPSGLADVNGVVYFSAFDSVHGYQVWRSDGTAVGTRMVTDIDFGLPGGGGPEDLTSAGGKLFFNANTPAVGNQLWVTDGTEPGTEIVTDSTGANFGYAYRPTNVNGSLYFTSETRGGLWRTDGTAGGTRFVADATAGDPTEVNGALYFVTSVNTQDFSLWKTDGTPAGTTMLRHFDTPGVYTGYPYLLNVDGTLFLLTNDGATGPSGPGHVVGEGALWTSDGTAAGTHPVIDFNAGIYGAGADYLAEVNGTLILSADDGVHGPQLWAIPATPAALSITPETLPDAAFVVYYDTPPNPLPPSPYAPYDQQLSVDGATGATTFTLAWGTLPPGLSLSATGALTGTPTQAGTFAFTVRVTDATGATAVQSYTLTVPAPTTVGGDVPTLPPVAPPLVVGAGPGQGGSVNVYDANGGLLFTLQPFGPGFTGGVSVAVGDLAGDGRQDIIVGAGAGGGPAVAVYDAITGAEERRFFAFAPSFTGGVNVAAGDVAGDGRPDIIVGAGAGGGPAVAVFDGRTGQAVERFFAFAPSFTGGVSVRVGDVTGSGHPEIVVGAGAGGGPLVEVFDATADQMIGSFLAYGAGERNGVRVGVFDPGTGIPDLVTADGPGRPTSPQAFAGVTFAPVTLPGPFPGLPVPITPPAGPGGDLPFSLTDPAWQTLPSGVRVWDVTQGSGTVVRAGDRITVNDTGYLTDGTVLAVSGGRDQPFSGTLNSSLIAGWVDGIPGMKVGGERRLHIPASLAYGSAGNGNIPPDADLIFDVTLLSDAGSSVDQPAPGSSAGQGDGTQRFVPAVSTG